jgi:hypothetical protein
VFGEVHVTNCAVLKSDAENMAAKGLDRNHVGGHVEVLHQRRDLSQPPSLSGQFPVLLEFDPSDGAPLRDQTKNPRRQAAVEQTGVPDHDAGAMAAIARLGFRQATT